MIKSRRSRSPSTNHDSRSRHDKSSKSHSFKGRRQYNSESEEEPVREKSDDGIRKDDEYTLDQSKKYPDGRSKHDSSRSGKHAKDDSKHSSVKDAEERDHQVSRSSRKPSSDKHNRETRRGSGDRSLPDGDTREKDYKNQRYDKSSSEYKRYWNSRDSEDASRNNDCYWSKYPARDRELSVGSRYYGEHSKTKPVNDKENLKRKRSKYDDRYEARNPKNSDGIDSKSSEVVSVKSGEPAVTQKKKNLDLLTTKTGGAYIPPARLRMMQEQITDKSSAAYQRISWEALKKSIHGHINKVNTANIGIIVRELLQENIVRGRGLLCRSIIQAQAASLTFTHVYAALVSVINSKFPNIGELLLRRLIIQFKRGFKRNDKSICISAASFIAHLVNQRVAHEILALEILTLLVESPTDDSVEVAIAFLKECGMKLMEVSNKGVHAIFEMLRNILHEGNLDKRVQYMIEVMHQVRKDNFQDHKAIIEELELVDEEDQFTHLLTLEDVKDPEDILNVFKFDPLYEENETKYKALKQEILDEGSDDSGDSNSGSDNDPAEESEIDEEKESTIIDNTETNLVALRRTIYLTISSSLDFEECAHKLMRMELKPGQEIELCHMFLDCCAEQRTYEKFYGLLSQRFCQINKIFIPPFQQIFRNTYDTIHRLDTNKLRNVAKFFAHLLFTDAISWEVLSLIRLNEEETSSSSRIFIKILFQELSEYMGLTKLNERVKDVTLQAAFDGLFPRDDPKNTRFAINFFTSIGLGGLTDELREHLKSQPKVSLVPKIAEPQQVSSSSSSSDSSSSSSSSDSSSDSSSSSESEDDYDHSKSKKRRSGQKKNNSKSKKVNKKRELKKKEKAPKSPVNNKKKKKHSR